MSDNTHYRTFGEYLVAKRKEKEIPSLQVAEYLGISPSYYSDIEKGRRNPPNERENLAKLAQILNLYGDDLAVFYDLAGKARDEAPPDLPDYINENHVVRVALRLAKDTGSSEDWQRFIDDLTERKKKGEE